MPSAMVSKKVFVKLLSALPLPFTPTTHLLLPSDTDQTDIVTTKIATLKNTDQVVGRLGGRLTGKKERKKENSGGDTVFVFVHVYVDKMSSITGQMLGCGGLLVEVSVR